jgi:hypothetical protein
MYTCLSNTANGRTEEIAMYSNELKNLIRKIDLDDTDGTSDLITAIEELERILYDASNRDTLSDNSQRVLSDASASLCDALKVLNKINANK